MSTIPTANLPDGWPGRNGQPRKVRRWPAALVTGAGSLVIGIVMGAAVSAQTEDAGTTSTVTETVTATPETKSVTKEITPDACLDALNHSDDLISASSDVADLAVGYIDLIPRAATAGANLDVDEADAVIAEMEKLTSQTEGLTTEVGPIRSDYEDAAAACRG